MQTKINVQLNGIAPIMFDRYTGKKESSAEDKVYLSGKNIVIPAINIMSFLCAKNTNSAAKRFNDVRAYSRVCDDILSFVTVEPADIPVMRNGKAIQFSGFENGEDKKAKMRLHHAVARLPKGIPNEKCRPVLDLPWSVAFSVIIYPNEFDVTPQMLKRLFDLGGTAIGLGTFRGIFGKFIIDKWQVAKENK